jgi:hypothetical protein
VGLIRKTLAVGTLGVVNGSSKKQRVAQATLDALLGTETREMASARREVARTIRRQSEAMGAATSAPAPPAPVKPFPSEGDWWRAVRRWWW